MTGRQTTNEHEFQGRVLAWLNAEIGRRPGLELDRAAQGTPREPSGLRSDIVVWQDRASATAFLSMQLATLGTPLNDPAFFADAVVQAQDWAAPYFAVWNMREAELYPTPPPGGLVTPADKLMRWPPEPSLERQEDWTTFEVERALQARAVAILAAAWGHRATGGHSGPTIDATLVVARLSGTIAKLRDLFYRDLVKKAHASARLRKSINKIAGEQGFKGFVENIESAIAGQMAHRLVGQILFYFALRRTQPALPPLKVERGDVFPAALLPFWSDLRRFDLEALFKPGPLDALVPIPRDGQLPIRSLIEHLSTYDWPSLAGDVVDSLLERLVPRGERPLLGLFDTPRPVADLLVAMTLRGERPVVLDPCCGSGTFLTSAYDCIAQRSGLDRRELLSLVWGFDLGPLAAGLAAIDLFRRDLAASDNVPRIVPGDFFERDAGQTVEFPQPVAVAGSAPGKVAVPIPQFDGIVGTPPYLRSLTQDDLEPRYLNRLFASAAQAGIAAEPRPDLFAFFMYHSLRLLRVGGRIGFVVPVTWLASDDGVALQKLLLDELRLVAIVASGAEAFFPQVDVNAVLLVAERVLPNAPTEPLRFVTLKQRIDVLAADKARRWAQLTELIDFIVQQDVSFEDARLRVKLVPHEEERAALEERPATPRNWAKFLRAPLSYYELFGDAA